MCATRTGTGRRALNADNSPKMIEADWKLIEPYLMENEKTVRHHD